MFISSLLNSSIKEYGTSGSYGIYIILNNGYVIQADYLSSNQSSGSTHNWIIPMAGGRKVVTAIKMRAAGATSNPLSVASLTDTTFKTYTGGDSSPIYWIAIGKI